METERLPDEGRYPTMYGTRRSCLFCLAVLSVSAAGAFAQGFSPEEAAKRMKLAPGLEIQLVASEPDIRQPVAMNFDDRGRMWVIQYLQYPNPAGLKAVKVDRYLRTVYDQLPEPPPKGPKGVDRITILEDSDDDGRADKFKDFVSGLNLTTGLAIGYGGVFVVQSPYLLFYPDKNRDDVPDSDPEVLLTGFGMEDAHAFANSLTWGPDGWLYGAQGSTVTARIRGHEFQQGIWRYHPVTKDFELFAEGGGNTWGLDFDRNGNVIAGTNYMAAMLHQVQGAYYVKGFEKHGPLHNPYTFGYFEHVPHKSFKGGHVTIGGIVYQGGSFPKEYNDQYIAANVLSNAIYWHTIERNGSTFTNRFGGDVLVANDTWFRPVDCTVGPDGSLFIADWYDKRANHVDPKDDWDKSNGRIYKLMAKGTKRLAPFDLAKLSSAELIKLLDHLNEWQARTARRLLAERMDKSVYPVLRESSLQSGNERLALESLWALYSSGGFDDAFAEKLLNHRSEYIRSWTVRLLGDARRISSAMEERLIALAKTEPSPVVRCQLACSAKRLSGKQALPIVRALLLRDEDVKDPFIPLLLWWAIEDKAASDRELTLGLLNDRAMWSRPLVREFIVERLARRYAAAGKPDDFTSCAHLLAMAPAVNEKTLLVRGMELGLAGKKLDSPPTVLVGPLEKLFKELGPTPTLLRLAIRLGSTDAPSRALAVVADQKRSPADRLALMEILGQVGQSECVPVLLSLIGGKEPAAIQTAALAALQRFPDDKIADEVLSLYPKLDANLRGRARELLIGRKGWAMALLTAVDAKKIEPKEVADDQLQKIALHDSAEMNALIEKHWGKIKHETTGEKMARVHGIRVSLKLAAGDPVKGKELFAKNCGVCHTLFGEGAKVGPDLTGADRKNQLFLLQNIVDPSAVIRKEYVAYTVLATDGRLLTGLLAESSPNSVTLLDSKNQKVVLAQDEIEEMKPSATSLMPEQILDKLEAQEVRDLMGYLQSETQKQAASAK